MLKVDTELSSEIPNYIWLDIKSFSPISPFKENNLNLLNEIEVIQDPPPSSYTESLCDMSSPPIKGHPLHSNGIRRLSWIKERIRNLMNQHITISREKHEKIDRDALSNMFDNIVLFNFKDRDKGQISSCFRREIIHEYTQQTE